MKHKYHSATLFLTLLFAATAVAQHVQVDSLKRIIRFAKSDTAKVNLYNKISNLYKDSNADSTHFFAKKAMSLALTAHYDLGIGTAAINDGNFNIITGNNPAALESFRKAQQTFETLLSQEHDNMIAKNGLARAFASMGVVYTQLSNYFMALENYGSALKIYQETKQRANISKALNNIGIVYKSQMNYPKALEQLKKAYEIQNELGERNAAMTLTNIGSIYFNTKQFPLAIQYYDRAEKAFLENENPNGAALLNNYLGDYYNSRDDQAKAEGYYRKSLDSYEQMQNKFGASLALYNLGGLYAAQKKQNQAMAFASKSLAYAKDIGALDQVYHSEKLLSELYGNVDNMRESFAHYKNYVSARDSIFNQESSRKFAQAEMSIAKHNKEAMLAETNKRSMQLSIFSVVGGFLLLGLFITIYNRRQVTRRLTLQKEIAEYEHKALHLQMNPHFVFNCLGAISSFIVQNGTDSALKYLSKFSKLMRLTLEYSKGSLIPIDKEIESLQNYLELEQLRFNNKFDFEIKSSAKVEFNMGLPPLLVQPFVENAILHGIVPKDGNGRIEVHFDVVNGQLICTITDDGIGISESKLLKEDSMTAHKSMALEITRKRLEFMASTTSKAAQLDIEELESNNKKSGTRIRLRLPIQYIP